SEKKITGAWKKAGARVRQYRQGRHLREGYSFFLRCRKMPCRGVRGRDPPCRHLSRRNCARVARNAHRGRRNRQHAEIVCSILAEGNLADDGAKGAAAQMRNRFVAETACQGGCRKRTK